MGKSKIIALTFCIIGIWLVWEFRLLGLFAYVALLLCVSISGAFEIDVMPKSKEKKTIRAMYWVMFLICVFVVSISFTDLMRPISIAIAKGPILPSFQDNVVLLVDGSKDAAAQLLADADPQKRRKIINTINAAKQSLGTYYFVNTISLAASLIYVIFTSMCITKSRLPVIDDAAISAMNARVREQGRLNITHNLLTMRIAFCLAGVIFLWLFFLVFVAFRIGPENVGIFWALNGGRSFSHGEESAGYFLGLLMFQAYAYFVLWHFARYPFGLKR